MKAQSCKSKGRALQKLVVQKIREYFPRLTDKDVRSTSMGAGGVDVQLSSAAFRKFPFAIECKNLAKIAIYKLYEQAVAHSKDHGGIPLLVVKQNRAEPLVVLSLDDFMKLVANK